MGLLARLGLLVPERTAPPAPGGTQRHLLYPKSGGQWYTKSASGIEMLVGGHVQDVWHTVGAAGEPAFQNGWAQGSDALQFTKRAGVVYVRGNVIAGTNAVTVFNLPTGYIPSGIYRQAVAGWSNGTGQVIVNTAGNFAVEYISGPTVPPRYNLGVCFAVDTY